jgi:hypothetical protein
VKFLSIILCFLGAIAQAEPLFRDLSHHLPEHRYLGGWNHFVGGGVAVMDCNGDSLPDIFAAGGTGPAGLFVNHGNFTFTAQPLPDIRASTGAYPIDINADGFMDLFVLRIGQNIILKGGPDCSFTPAKGPFTLPAADQWSTAFSAWWQDDGRPEMAVGNYVDLKNPEGPFFACDSHELLTPRADGYQSTPLEPGFCSLSMLTTKDASGALRLRISNDRQYYVRGGYEQMWDLKERRFLGASDGWEEISIWGMGIASRDITGDGREEVMLTSMGDQLMQMAQLDGTYRNAPFSIGTYAHRPYLGDDGRPSTGWHAQFGDMDNDGRADLFISKGNVDQMPSNAIKDPNNLLMQQADGTFREMGQTAGLASTERGRGAALADFDGDGRLDVLVLNRRAPLEIYRNETPNAGHWLAVSLLQPGGNRHAIGASVTVNGDMQRTIIGGGHAGGQAGPLHFGLGAATQAEITVEWPGGQITHHKTAANQAITLSP